MSVERKGWNWKQRVVTGQTLSSLKERSNSCPKPIGGTKSKTAHNLTPEKSRRSELEPQLESRKVTTSSSTWRNCLVRVLSFQNPFFWFRVPFFFICSILFLFLMPLELECLLFYSQCCLFWFPVMWSVHFFIGTSTGVLFFELHAN